MAIGNHPFASGDFSRSVRLATGQSFVDRRAEGRRTRRSSGFTSAACRATSRHTRSPATGGRCRPRTSRWTSSTSTSTPRGSTRRSSTTTGSPIWWYHTPAWGTKVLANGTVLWFDRSVVPGTVDDPSPRREPGSHAEHRGPRGQPSRPAAARQRGVPGRHVRQAGPRGHERLRRLTRRQVINAELQQVGTQRPAGLGLEEPEPHLARRDRAALELDREPPERGRLRHPPLELDRARRQRGDRFVQAPRRGL